MTSNSRERIQLDAAVRDLKNYRPSKTFSCVLFGYSGSGKSSIVNNVDSVSKRFVEHVAKVRIGSSDDQCTVSYQGYPFGEKVTVFDTWGLSSGENYKREEFGHMLDGEVGSGSSESSFRSTQKEQARIINKVVFVLSPEVVTQEEELVKMKEFYDFAKGKGCVCLVAVTKVDEWCESVLDKNILIEEDPKIAYKKVFKSRKWKTTVQALVNRVLDPTVQVLPIINYSNEETRKDPIIQYFIEEFVLELTKSTCTCPFPCIIHPTVIKQLMPDLFAGEDTFTLTYAKNQQVSTTPFDEVKIDSSVFRRREEKKSQREVSMVRNLSRFVFPDIFFRVLDLGSLNFRFFVSTSLLTPNEMIIGLYCYNTDNDRVDFTYFETASCRHDLVPKLEETFTERYQPSYEFVSDPSSQPSKTTFELDLPSTKLVHLNFFGGDVHLVLERKKVFPDYAGSIESRIQVIKKNQLLLEKTTKKVEEVLKKVPDPPRPVPPPRDPTPEFRELLKTSLRAMKKEILGKVRKNNEEIAAVVSKFVPIEYVVADYQATVSTYYVSWRIGTNSLGYRVRNSVANYAYHLPRGTYLVFWKSTFPSTGNNSTKDYIALYKQGSVLDQSHKADAHGYNQSPMIMKMVDMNGGNDYLSFYCSKSPETTNNNHRLVILKMGDPRVVVEEEEEQEGESDDEVDISAPLKEIQAFSGLRALYNSADFQGSSSNFINWRIIKQGFTMNFSNSTRYTLPRGKYLVLWKTSMQNYNNNQYITLYKNQTNIDFSYSTLCCCSSKVGSPCITKIVEMNGSDYLRFQSSTTQWTQQNAHSLEILKLEDSLEAGHPTTSCVYASQSSNSTKWTIQRNGCGLFNSSGSSYSLPQGMYLIIWKGCFTNTGYISLRKCGQIVDYSFEQSCSNYYHSPTIVTVVFMNGTSDYLDFNSSQTPYGSANYHSLEILKLGY